MLRRVLFPLLSEAKSVPDAAAVAALGGNATAAILGKVGRDLHRQRGHPIQRVVAAVHQEIGVDDFALFDQLSPVVTAEANFDSLLVRRGAALSGVSWTFLTPFFCFRCSAGLVRHRVRETEPAAANRR